MLGTELTEENYKKLVKDSALSVLTLKEIINLASSLDSFWEISGTYYKLQNDEIPTIIIDREQSVGGYNNSELTLSVVGNYISSNDTGFKTLVYESIDKKRIPSRTDSVSEDILTK